MTKKKGQVRRIQKGDLEYVIKNIRDQDRVEIEAASGQGYERCLRSIEKYCETIWCATVDGVVIAIFGIEKASDITKTGYPWFISTKEIEKNKMIFIRHCKEVFGYLIEDYSYLVNYVDERNTLAKLWLKWLGFNLESPTPFGHNQVPFHKFTMRREYV